MEVAEALDAVRRGFDGCRLLVYADLAVPLPLVVSSDEPPARDRLDRLCAETVAVFRAADAATAEGLDGSGLWIALSGSTLRLCLREPAGVEALIAEADAGLGVEPFLDALRVTLASLTGVTEDGS